MTNNNENNNASEKPLKNTAVNQIKTSQAYSNHIAQSSAISIFKATKSVSKNMQKSKKKKKTKIKNYT